MWRTGGAGRGHRAGLASTRVALVAHAGALVAAAGQARVGARARVRALRLAAHCAAAEGMCHQDYHLGVLCQARIRARACVRALRLAAHCAAGRSCAVRVTQLGACVRHALRHAWGSAHCAAPLNAGLRNMRVPGAQHRAGMLTCRFANWTPLPGARQCELMLAGQQADGTEPF